MNRVIHFELEAIEPERIAEFYREVFQWDIKQLEDHDQYWAIKTGSPEQKGINGAIIKAKNQPRTINTVKVASIDSYAKKIVLHGGKIVSSKIEIPQVGLFYYCEDPEGNAFGVIEHFA